MSDAKARHDLSFKRTRLIACKGRCNLITQWLLYAGCFVWYGGEMQEPSPEVAIIEVARRFQARHLFMAIVSLLTTTLSMILALYSVFDKNNLRGIDEQVINFVYKFNIVTISALCLCVTSAVYAYVLFRMRRGLRDKLRIEVSNAGEKVTLDLSKPGSIDEQIKRLMSSVEEHKKRSIKSDTDTDTDTD